MRSVRFRQLLVATLCASSLAGCSFRRFAPMYADVEFSEKGLPIGAYRLYSAGGRLEAMGQFEDGQRTGVWAFWDSPGIKVVELTYVRGIKEGACQMWFGSFAYPWAAGTMNTETTFSADRQDGRRWTWWPEGRLRCQTDVSSGTVVDAWCWDGNRNALPRDQALELARQELDADSKYLRMLDESVEDSIRDAFKSRNQKWEPLPPEKLRVEAQ